MMAIPFALLVFANTASAQNIVLLKEDFESGGKMPEGWKSGAPLAGVNYVYDKSSGKSGERSLSLQKSAQRYFPIAQWYRTVPYKGELGGLKVTSQVRAENATKAIVDVTFLDRNGKSQGHEWVAYIGSKNNGDPPANHDWKEYSGVVAVPKTTSKIRIALQIYGPGKVWFDDIEATYVRAVQDGDGNPDDKPELDNKVEIKIKKETGHYLSIPARNKKAPEKGNGLLIVLPGGDGSADFHPFVSRIHANSLGDDYVLAQPLARKWTDEQVVVWPTSKLKVKKMGYTTEQLIEAVYEDVAKKTKIDPKRVYLLGWSSGGPAVYASLLKRSSPATGGIAAMSVYKPDQLPKPTGAKGRSVYILHSPDDRVCPYWMAKKGHEELMNAEVRTKMVDYEGGHGWRGDVFGNIQKGTKWLEDAPAASDKE